MIDEQTVTELLDPTTHAEQLEQSIAAHTEAARQEERDAIAIFLKLFIDDVFAKSGVGSETVKVAHRLSLLIRSGDYLACSCLGGDR